MTFSTKSLNLNPIFTRGAKTGATAVVAAIALLGATAPAHADVAATSRVRIPAGAWVMTQAADGHLAVVTGRTALEDATKAADGSTGPQVLSVQPDQVVHS